MGWVSPKQGGGPWGQSTHGLAALSVGAWGPPAQLRSTAGRSSGLVLALGLPGVLLRGPFFVTSLHANGQFSFFLNNIY